MGFLTRCKRPFLFAFLLQFCNMLFAFFLKTFLILFEKQHSFSRFVSVVLPLPVPPAMPMIKLSIPQCLPFFFVPHA